MSFFEGSEKKIEFGVKSNVKLRSFDRDYWVQLVAKARAQILSEISSDACTAYLLSESSLFVWDDRMLLITCGTTTLSEAAHFFIDKVGEDNIDFMIFERKNEYMPHLQHTDFYEDVAALRKRIKGRAFRFGKPDEHHLFLFHSTQKYQPDPNDCTIELLMYDLQGPARDVFSGKSCGDIRKITNVDRIFPGFKVDDFSFNPCGYSLNALRGSDYYTIHVTPQEQGSYVSFESNVNLDESITNSVCRVLEIFRPKMFDVAIFKPDQHFDLDIPGFSVRKRVRQTLQNGYKVVYYNYLNPENQDQEAQEIMKSGDNGMD